MGLRLRLLWLSLTHPLGAPLRWIERRAHAKREHELALARLHADSQARMFESIGRANAEAIKQLAAPLEANAKVLTTWLEGFKTVQIPTSRVMDEEMELGNAAEAARETLEAQQREDADMLKSAFEVLPAEFNEIPWDDADGRPAPPIPPDFFS